MQNTVFKWWFDPFLIGCEVANVTFISLGVEVDLYSHSSSGNDSYERGLFKIWEIVAPENSVLHLNVIDFEVIEILIHFSASLFSVVV